MPDTRHLVLAGKRVLVSPESAERLWRASRTPDADPVAAEIYRALIAAEAREKAPRRDIPRKAAARR